MKQKVKVEVERPVFCAVEQTKHAHMDRYRVAVHNKLVNGKITIDRVEYTLVTSQQPSVNGHHFREYCMVGNAAHKQQYQASLAIKQEEQARKMQADRAARAERAKQDRQARWQERKDGARKAGVILREMAIMNRKMEEVETGEQCLPAAMLRPGRRLV